MSFTNDCDLHIQQLKSCFEETSKKLAKQMENNPDTHLNVITVSLHPRSNEVNLDTITSKDCQLRIYTEFTEHLHESLPKRPKGCRGFYFKPSSEWSRTIYLVQGKTLFGTALKTQFFGRLWPFK